MEYRKISICRLVKMMSFFSFFVYVCMCMCKCAHTFVCICVFMWTLKQILNNSWLNRMRNGSRLEVIVSYWWMFISGGGGSDGSDCSDGEMEAVLLYLATGPHHHHNHQCLFVLIEIKYFCTFFSLMLKACSSYRGTKTHSHMGGQRIAAVALMRCAHTQPPFPTG